MCISPFLTYLLLFNSFTYLGYMVYWVARYVAVRSHKP